MSNIFLNYPQISQIGAAKRRKGDKRGFEPRRHEGAGSFFLQDLQDDPFGRLRAGRIAEVEGASPESR